MITTSVESSRPRRSRSSSERRADLVEVRQVERLEHPEVVAVRVPVARPRDSVVTVDEGDARLDQPPRDEQARAEERRAVLLA